MRAAILGLFATGLVTIAGCQTCNRPPAPRPAVSIAPAPPCAQPQPVPGAITNPVPVPVNPAAVPPGTPTPGAVVPSAVPPGNPTPFPTVPAESRFPIVPPPGPQAPNGAAPTPNGKIESRWSPNDPLLGETPKVKLYPPDATGNSTKEPPVGNEKPGVGIPKFASALPKVDVGLRPALDDGLDWLQNKGYRAVLHVHLPEQNDGPDRKQVEKRGMKYLSLEMTPQSLNSAVLDEFVRLVRDPSTQPLFVYDNDGALTGTLWYLYFRTTEQHSDDVARIRAGALGLRPDQEGLPREMWQAAQKLLEERNR